jgi:hypothetical protein
MKNNAVKNMIVEVVTSYVTTSTIALAGSILGLSLTGIEPARSASFSYSGDTTGAPTWNRPNDNGSLPPTSLSSFATATPYDVFKFTVDTSGSYTFVNTVANFDSFGLLYQNAFNPLTPLTNAIISNDDGGGNAQYLFTTTLSTNTNYFLVTTGYENFRYGRFTTNIDSIGNVLTGSSTAVPEPLTIIGTLIGGTAALRMRKKLKSAKQM